MDVVVGRNLMHKMTNATVDIGKAMASNAYNGTSDKRILKRPMGVHQVEVNSSILALDKKLDVLTKQMETLRKAQTQRIPIPCL